MSIDDTKNVQVIPSTLLNRFQMTNNLIKMFNVLNLNLKLPLAIDLLRFLKF